MKKDWIWALAALLLVYLLPLALPGGPPALAEPPGAEAAPVFEALPLPAERAEPEATGTAAAAASRTLLQLQRGQEQLELELEDYLLGAVAAEMPASFPQEALKAQAVAARTYALYCARSGKHPGADLCADPGCCQAWLPEERLRENWGQEAEENLARVRRAVEETRGQVLCYEGEPILAAFHSSSAGATEDCGAVWNPRPYLVSVSSPEGAGDVPGFVSSLRCAPIDFRDVLLSACPEADFSGPEEGWIGPLQRDESGRVASAELGGRLFSGTELRRLFSLRSTAFSLEYSEGVFVFTVTGYGHGVGMSQYGAMVLARDGADYRQILAHYYPGASLTDWDSLAGEF